MCLLASSLDLKCQQLTTRTQILYYAHSTHTSYIIANVVISNWRNRHLTHIVVTFFLSCTLPKNRINAFIVSPYCALVGRELQFFFICCMNGVITVVVVVNVFTVYFQRVIRLLLVPFVRWQKEETNNVLSVHQVQPMGI